MSERVPEGWKNTTIGDAIADIADGGTPSTANPEYFGGDIPWVVIDDIQPRITQTKSTITDLGLRKSSAKLWDKGTIILSTGATIGEVGIATKAMTTKQGICGIVPKDDVSVDYFYHLLVSKKRQLNTLSQGSTIKETRPPTIKKIQINLPPLPEQKKIASILTSVDEVIENTQKQMDKLQDLKKATMNELLTKGIGQLEYKGSKLGKIPKNWEAVKLSNMLKLMTDYVANGSFGALRNNIKVLDKVDYALYVRLYDLRLGLGHAKQKYVPKDTYDFLQKSSIETNDLLIANIGANVGEVFMMPSTIKPSTIAPNMILMRCNHKVANPHFLFEFLSSDIGKRSISVAISGSGQPKINKTDLKKIKILVPTIYEQNIISSVMKSLDDIILKKMKKLTQTQSLKKSLMQDLLTGKVRVKVN